MHPDIHARPHPAANVNEYDLDKKDTPDIDATPAPHLLRTGAAIKRLVDEVAAEIKAQERRVRRERIATYVMAALAGHHGAAGVHPHILASTAAAFADALIAELDRRPEEGERPVEHDG
jgi:hypothetical protein